MTSRGFGWESKPNPPPNMSSSADLKIRAWSNGKYAFRKYVFCKAYFGKGVGSYGKEYSAEIEMHANLFLD